ncbi:MAG: VWA domain-containing protein, partial [Planctomycetes bacterium]|nr:VWA domain-containing protein [Planctomycetota bacterium]
GTDATLTIQKGRATTYDEVIDEFAIKIIEVVERKPLLIVFLFDESSSLMDDRKMINQKIDNVIKSLKSKVGEKELGRAQWAVVSFGTTAKVIQTATANLDQAKAAIAERIKEDAAGVENVLGGIEFVLASFKDVNRQLFITLVTDETGDDTVANPKNDAKIEALIAALKARNARLYVFGREANFGYPYAYAPYYGPTGDIIDWNWISAGPESAFQELFDHDWLFNPAARNLPSGFGMFAQCLLADRSGGLYFALSDVPSKYDDEKMKDYRPEMVTRKEYLERTEQSPLRRAVKIIITEWPKYRPTHWLTQLDKIADQANGELKKADQAYDFCQRDALPALNRMRPTDKFRPKRWEANYDLVRALLYKFMFMLRQYQEALAPCVRKGFPPPPKGKPFNGYLVTLDPESKKLPGGRQAQNELEDAEDALRLVIRKHADTPWAVFAERELQTLKPMKVIPHFYVPTDHVKM